MNEWLRFLGWYLAEGSAFRDRGGYVISLGLGEKDLKYKEEIDRCIRILGAKPHWKHRKGEHAYEIRLSHKQLYSYLKQFGHAEDKFVPVEMKALPPERLKILLDALLKGDGQITRTKSLVFGTVASPRLAEDVAELALKCGHAVSLGYSKDRVCSVYLNTRRHTVSLKDVTSVYYDGPVYCATVPNHVMLVERNGKVVWSGNSSDVSFKVMNEQIDWRRYHVPDEAPLAVITHICLPSYERILAIVDGQPRLTEIGTLVDEQIRLEKNTNVRDGVTYVTPGSEIAVPSLDPDSFKVQYVSVRRFMKRVGGDILRITAEEGRTVNVSPEHPLLVMTPHGIEVKPANKLVEGDYLIAAKRLPATGNQESEYLDLIDCFTRAQLTDSIVVVGAKELLYQNQKRRMSQTLGVPPHRIDNWRRYDRIPLWAYLRVERSRSLRQKVRLIGYRSHGKPIPPLVRLDKDFARLLGFYTSEGCSNCKRNNVVSFSFHRDEISLQEEVIDLLSRTFQITPVVDRKKKDRAVQITAYNKALALLFTKVLRSGVDSYTKRVPDFVFATRVEFIKNLLDAYFAGDGYLYRPRGHLQASTASEELAHGLFVLMRMTGMTASVSKYEGYYRIDVEGGRNTIVAKEVLPTIIAMKGNVASAEYRPSIAERIPAFVFSKNDEVPSSLRRHIGGGFSSSSRISTFVAEKLGIFDAYSRKFLSGDIQCLQVRRVEVVKYEGSYYNIETFREDLPNYMHGFGIFSHNCSTKVPYKTVGKEYIADRPEIESEIRNALREALRRLSLYLSKKGSMEAVQRKINIYGKYLPMIAKFATELAERKKLPNYKRLVKESEEAPSEEEAGVGDEQKKEGQGKLNGQGKIEEYS